MIDHHVSFHRNRSLWAVITNMAFLILNHVNDHHVFGQTWMAYINMRVVTVSVHLILGLTHMIGHAVASVRSPALQSQLQEGPSFFLLLRILLVGETPYCFCSFSAPWSTGTWG